METKVKVIVTGGRDFNDYKLLKSTCDSVIGKAKNIEIVSGHSGNTDILAEKYADEMGFTTKIFPADYQSRGMDAGLLRNLKMVDYGDILIAFWNRNHALTAHVIMKAKKAGKKVTVVYY
jgi:hypothetical protein